ncbi:hypothetical protein RAJCM14343_4722 [Rhodococcus aetherivorans]|uniref:SGNH hydrolase-type esterase domain-containing protein n=1 Tax=Rhodococcus aetherivorans TaxID=191292 RepID=A0ABQ0YSN0_9NOCA|nr:hypothetical protein [Rhodococcus aetherivorans]ETT26227.1 hypothetical protein RR21198_3105 [Rhodococcus rhodochrous ATCC 21198]NGP25895.1 hypothetical protein [Rhodococcus aetherivorans]GES39451.1 hypothetical protein RAJCM14343_4722 [Rhodococcus aetherivorans]
MARKLVSFDEATGKLSPDVETALGTGFATKGEVGAKLDQTAVDARVRAVGDATYVRPPGTRVGMIPFSAPNTIAAATVTDLTQRSLVQLPFDGIEWRLGVRNMSNRSTTVPTTPCTITGVWTGAPQRTTGNTTGQRWNGNIQGAVTQVAGQFSVPTDGSFGWTDWIQSDPIQAGIEKVISWGLTTPATGTGIANGNALQGVLATGAAQASQAVLTDPVIARNSIRLDVVVQYRFAETVQHGLYVGDSRTISYSQSRLPLPALVTDVPVSALPHESWPLTAAAMSGAAGSNLGVGSTTLADWAVNNLHLWDRVPAGEQYDFAVVSLGINGISGGLNGFSTHMQTINARLRSMGIGRIWWTTIAPAGYADQYAKLTAPAAAGATTLSLSASPPAGTLLVGSGYNTEDVTVSSVSGTGPYTATLSAGTAYAHTTDEAATWNSERWRRVINALLRQLPDGIAGCVDFERVLEATPGSPVGDPRLVDSDGIHYTRAASVEMARSVAAVSSRPLFA